MAKKIKITDGIHMKAVCALEGIRQQELAGEAGIAAETISRYWNGKRTITLTTKAKLVKAINRLVGEKKYKAI